MCASARPDAGAARRHGPASFSDCLAEVVRAGKTHANPAPYDDPMSFYEPDPDLRVAKWLRAIWRRRGQVDPDAWRLYFVVMVDGRPGRGADADRSELLRSRNGHHLLGAPVCR